MNKTLKNFFFPDDTKLKVESAFDFWYDKKQRKYVVRYRFYTLRSLTAHLLGVGIKLPARKAIQIAKEQPAFAIMAVASFILFFFQSFKGVSNLMLIGGAIAYDTSNSGQAGSGTTLTVAITPTGANRVMVAGLSANAFPSGATFNAVTMTQVVQEAFNRIDTIWRLIAPDLGTNNLVFSFSNTLNGGGGVNFTGADQTNPIDGSDHSHGNGTSFSQSLTTTLANTFLFGIITISASETLTPNAGQTDRWNFDQNGQMAAATKPTTTAGSYSIGWSHATSSTNEMCIVGVAELQITSAIKTINGLAKANVKTINGLAIASVKSWNGLE